MEALDEQFGFELRNRRFGENATQATMDNNIIATINNTLTRTKHMQGSDLVSLADKPRSLLLFADRPPPVVAPVGIVTTLAPRLEAPTSGLIAMMFG